MLSSKQALIVAIFPLSFLQGVFTVFAAAYLYFVWYQRKRTRTRRSWLGLAAVLTMYTISSAHFIMVFYQDLTGFGGPDDTQSPNPRRFAVFGLAQIALVHVNCSLADVLLTWRTWAIYNKDWRVIALPVCLVLGSTAASYGGIAMSYVQIHTIVGDDLQAVYEEAMLPAVRKFQLSGFVLSTTTNVLLTSMIAYKLLSHHRSMKSSIGFSMLVVETMVIIESGALYSLAWIVLLVLYLLGHNAAVILLDIISQLAGIVPTLIVVTVSAGLSPMTMTPSRFASMHVASYTNGANANHASRPISLVLGEGAELSRSPSVTAQSKPPLCAKEVV